MKLPRVQWQADDPAFHEGEGESVSFGKLKDFASSRREFAAVHVKKTKPRKPPSDAMKLGTAVDLALMQPERFDDKVLQFPKLIPKSVTIDGQPYPTAKEAGAEWNFRRPIHRKIRDAWLLEKEEAGKVVLTAAEIAGAKATADAVREHDEAGELMFGGDGHYQYAVRFTDEETGLEVRLVFDRLALLKSGFLIDELKTTADASPNQWSRRFADLGYGIQAALYEAAAVEVVGEQVPIVHIVAETSEFHRVAVRPVPEDVLAPCRLMMRYYMAELAECVSSDDWREPWERESKPTRLPRWKTRLEGVTVEAVPAGSAPNGRPWSDYLRRIKE